MSLDAQSLATLRGALAAALTQEARGAAIRDEIARVREALTRADTQPSFLPEPTQHPLVAQLAPAIDAAAVLFPDLAAALHPLAAALPWRYGYAPRADLPGLETRMGWFELIGPAAPFHSDEVGLGLTYLAAHTVYPAHSHPAVELYRVVAGRPLWTVENETRRLAPPDVILHRSGAAHAMFSENEPLLAIYTWTGDILSPSVWRQPQDP